MVTVVRAAVVLTSLVYKLRIWFHFITQFSLGLTLH